MGVRFHGFGCTFTVWVITLSSAATRHFFRSAHLKNPDLVYFTHLQCHRQRIYWSSSCTQVGKSVHAYTLPGPLHWLSESLCVCETDHHNLEFLYFVNLLDCLSPFEDLVIQMDFLCLCISMRVGSAFLHRFPVGDLTHDKTQFTCNVS